MLRQQTGYNIARHNLAHSKKPKSIRAIRPPTSPMNWVRNWTCSPPLRLNLAAFYTDFSNRPTAISNGAEALLDSAGNPVVGNQKLEPSSAALRARLSAARLRCAAGPASSATTRGFIS